MTVISWDGRLLAADSQMQYGGYRCPTPVAKIVRSKRGDCAYGMTGLSAWFPNWIEWFEAGAVPNQAPETKLSADMTGNFLVFWPNATALYFSPELPYGQSLIGPDAWGSGAEFAIGAMMAGADAKRAAEIAVIVNVGCGGPVDVIDLHALKAKELAA